MINILTLSLFFNQIEYIILQWIIIANEFNRYHQLINWFFAYKFSIDIQTNRVCKMLG